jgi:hypothetical protein
MSITQIFGFIRRFMTMLLTLILLGRVGFAQGPPSGRTFELSSESYSRLLDTLFPRQYPPSLKLDYLMILRFQPNELPESQLVIRAWHDGHVEAVLYTVSGGSVWGVANKYLAQTGKEDVRGVANSIKVKATPLSLSTSTVEGWHTSLFTALREEEAELERSSAEFQKNGTREAVLDGARYDLWYVQGENESHWSFSDLDTSATSSGGNLPLGRWMNRVRLATSKP